jgi:multiple sugar transport system permease protein
MSAYAFARLRFPGRDKLFFLFLTAMMIPPIFTLIPNFVLIKNLGLAEHLPGDHGAVLPDDAVRGVLPAPVLPGISTEVEEAALLDGAGAGRSSAS